MPHKARQPCSKTTMQQAEALTSCSLTPMPLALPKKTKPLRLQVVNRPLSISSAACCSTVRMTVDRALLTMPTLATYMPSKK